MGLGPGSRRDCPLGAAEGGSSYRREGVAKPRNHLRNNGFTIGKLRNCIVKPQNFLACGGLLQHTFLNAGERLLSIRQRHKRVILIANFYLFVCVVPLWDSRKRQLPRVISAFLPIVKYKINPSYRRGADKSARYSHAKLQTRGG